MIDFMQFLIDSHSWGLFTKIFDLGFPSNYQLFDTENLQCRQFYLNSNLECLCAVQLFYLYLTQKTFLSLFSLSVLKTQNWLQPSWVIKSNLINQLSSSIAQRNLSYFCYTFMEVHSAQPIIIMNLKYSWFVTICLFFCIQNFYWIIWLGSF